MRPFSPSVIVLVTQLTAASLAVPGQDSSVNARIRFSSDASIDKAGTFFNRRNLLPHGLEHRRRPLGITVNIPGTLTYIVITVGTQIAGNAVQNLLANAAANIENHIVQQGDGVIANGNYNQLGQNAVSLQVWNANNHQTTYGVLVGALEALQTWMSNNGYSGAHFGIYDGPNQVGTGAVNGPAG